MNARMPDRDDKTSTPAQGCWTYGVGLLTCGAQHITSIFYFYVLSLFTVRLLLLHILSSGSL